MKKFRCIFLPLVVLIISFTLYPALAHRKPPQDCTPPKPKPPPQDEPKPKPPPQEEPKPKPPPKEEPKPKPPPKEEPKPKPPPKEDPKPKSPPQEDPKPKPPPQNPPEDPKPKPPKDNKPEPPQEPQKPTPFHDKYKGCFSSMYAFGDSYTDTGNAQFMGSLTISFSGSLSSPYGSTTFGKSSNRLCDGRLVLDFITDSLGLPVLPPYQSTSANFTSGANFAIAGCTTVANDLFSKFARLFLWKATPLGVWTQLEWYKKFQVDHLCKGLDQNGCQAKMKTALFWVGEIGINDYSRAVGSKIPLRSIAKSSVVYTTELVRTLIRNGAKNIVVQGLPPLGCLPLDISITPISIRDRSGCSQIVNAAVVIHNQILQAKLEILRKLFPDVTIIYADSWKAYYNIVNNAAKCKIRETRRTCCGASAAQDNLNFNLQSLCGSAGTSICDNPSQYISWDGIHPTESMNYHMTDQYINNGCCNPPFEQLMKKSAAV
uniref:GDSL esterase/lipase At3g48460-like n=1 Tax=Erigeron canadensis TaxID=72917 RepID=UPI001CB901F9|nr:GDSL esterase/lipase At3g48460-like [Erigeron canadensis]